MTAHRASALLATLALAACSTEEGTESPIVHEQGFTVLGEIPDGIDIADYASDLPETGFGIVADPGSGRVATLISADARARIASGEFSISTPASCPDCTDPTCGSSFLRTMQIELSHDSGINGETYSVQTTTARNFAAPVTTPSAWTADVGNTIALTTLGTLSSCSAFAYYFDVVGPDAPPCTPPTAAQLNTFAPAGASDIVFDGACRAWIPTIISGPDTAWAIDDSGVATTLAGFSNHNMGAIALDPLSGEVQVAYTLNNNFAYLGVETGGSLPVVGTGASIFSTLWANFYLQQTPSSIAIDSTGCTWFPNFSGNGTLDCLTVSPGFGATTIVNLGATIDSVALDASEVPYATTGPTIWRVNGPGDATVFHVAPAPILDMVITDGGDIYYETTANEIRRLAAGAGSSTSFSAVAGDGKLAIAPDGTLFRGQLNPVGPAIWTSFTLP